MWKEGKQIIINSTALMTLKSQQELRTVISQKITKQVAKISHKMSRYHIVLQCSSTYNSQPNTRQPRKGPFMLAEDACTACWLVLYVY